MPKNVGSVELHYMTKIKFGFRLSGMCRVSSHLSKYVLLGQHHFATASASKQRRKNP